MSGESAKPHTYPRPLEWNDKRDRRCSKCKRLGSKENYVEGPLQLVDGEHVRTWLCRGGCKPVKTDHYEQARPPKRYDGEDLPRGHGLAPVKYKNKVPSAKALKRDVQRMAESAKRTSADSLLWSKTDAMKHPSPKSQNTRNKKKGR